MIALALVFSLVIQATIVRAYQIPTPSMEPTIMTDDRILTEKVTLRFREPEPGDVVVITDPDGGPIPFVKRVIAVAGQTVDVRDGGVWVEGRRLAEPYTHGLPSLPASIALPVSVPDGTVWVMGDNRTNSKDSRYFGPVPVKSIRARALCVYWPPRDLGGMGE